MNWTSYPNQNSKARATNTPVVSYSLSPPILKLLNTELGYADVFPQQKDQQEDILNETTAKFGFIDHDIIKNDNDSAFESLSEILKDQKVINQLSAFSGELFKAQNNLSEISNNSVFSPPARQLLSDQKRVNWINDLVQGEERLELIPQEFIKKCSTWLQKRKTTGDFGDKESFNGACGLVNQKKIEENAMKMKKRPDAVVDLARQWTIIVTAYLKKQLELIVKDKSHHHHSNKKISSNINDSVKNFDSPADIQHFLHQWNYFVQLIKWQYAEGLLDQRYFLKVILTYFDAANFDQTSFLFGILFAFIKEYSKSRVLVKILNETCLKKIQRIRSFKNQTKIIHTLYHNLMFLLQSSILNSPDTVVSPKMWNSYEDVFTECFNFELPTTMPPNFKEELSGTLKCLHHVIKKRNERLLLCRDFNNYSYSNIEYHQLNNFNCDMDLEDVFEEWVAYYGFEKTGLDKLEYAIHKLCDWSIKSIQKNCHRPFLVGTLLKKLEEKLKLRNKLQDHLVHFLEVICDDDDIDACRVFHLFGELGHLRLFSYQMFLQRVISRGDLECFNTNEVKKAWFYRLLKELPLYNAELYQINLRRVTLYGAYGERCNSEDTMEENISLIKHHLKVLFPNIFNSIPASSITYPFRNAKEEFYVVLYKIMDLLNSKMKRYCQIKLCDWIKSHIYSYVVNHAGASLDNWKSNLTISGSLLNSEQYTTLINLFEQLEDIRSVVEVSIWTITNSVEREVFNYVLDSFEKHESAVFAMNKTIRLFTAVYDKHKELKSKSMSHLRLLQYSIHLLKTARIKTITANEANQLDLDLRSLTTPGRDVLFEAKDISELTDHNSWNTLSVPAINSKLKWKYSASFSANRDLYLKFVDILSSFQRSNLDRFELRKCMDLFCKILKDCQSQNGFMKQIIINDILNWKENIDKTTKYPQLNSHDETGYCWVVIWFSSLVANRCCSAIEILEKVCLPLLQQICSNFILLRLPLIVNVMSLTYQILANEDLLSQNFFQIYDIHTLKTIRLSEFRKENSLSICMKILDRTIKLQELKEKVDSQNISIIHLFKIRQDIIYSISMSGSWIKVLFLEDGVKMLKLLDSSLTSTKVNVKETESSNEILPILVLKTILVDTNFNAPLISNNEIIISMQEILSNLNKFTWKITKIRLEILLNHASSLQSKENKTLEKFTEALGDYIFELVVKRKLNENLLMCFIDSLDATYNVPYTVLKRFSILFRNLKSLAEGDSESTFDESFLWLKDVLMRKDMLDSFATFSGLLLNSLIEKTAKNPSSDNNLTNLKNDLIYICNELCESLQYLQKKLKQHEDSIISAPLPNCSLDEKESNIEELDFSKNARSWLYFFLNILVPFIPFIINNAKSCQLVSYVRCLIQLLTSKILYLHEDEELFSFLLDLVWWLNDDDYLMDELKELQRVLIIPSKSQGRINQIMPWKVNNVYTYNLNVVSLDKNNNLVNTNPFNLRPWEWLEDWAEPVTVSSKNTTPTAYLNNTPISLSMFGAVHVVDARMQRTNLQKLSLLIDVTKDLLTTEKFKGLPLYSRKQNHNFNQSYDCYRYEVLHSHSALDSSPSHITKSSDDSVPRTLYFNKNEVENYSMLNKLEHSDAHYAIN
ncbi:RNA polymerase II mediator complex subunit [Lobulomyces angularis]|nr:RNA polymerase II mediator complex subunit [Lobulomyces angularis]